MTKEHFYNLEFIMNLLGKRIIPCYFYAQNPRGLVRWQFNMCRQTAVICAQIAEQLLLQWGYNLTDDPSQHDPNVNQYNVQAWDGNFVDPTQGAYNHAWCFLEHNLDPNKDILIDTARVTRNIGVRYSDNDPVKFLTCEVRKKKTVETDRMRLEYRDMSDDSSEYFTKKTPEAILEDIRDMLGMYFKEFRPEQMYA